MKDTISVSVMLLLILCGFTWSTAHAEDLIGQGEYIFKVAGCQACHTDTKNKGPILAGGRALATPFGTFYSPNLTPDPQYGLGKWSEEDFTRALHQGISPRGYAYFPVFPFPSYTHMSRTDIHALWAYLRTIPPIASPNHAHDLPWYFGRSASWAWQTLFFTPSADILTNTPPAHEKRGEYIATALSHCQECHTPRTPFGTLNQKLTYAGTLEGPEGATVPNITSDTETGIGKWSKADLVDFFQEGALPNGDYVGGLMAEVVDNGLKYLTKEDVDALAQYIKAVPPIHRFLGGGNPGF